MDKLLFATDFSENSENALGFAKGIAAKSIAEVILFNSTSLPMLDPSIPSFMVEEVLEDQERSAKDRLHQVCADINNERYFDGKRIACDYNYSPGPATKEIATLANKENVDYVIMGAYDNAIISRWVGSTTKNTLERVGCPVIAVPPNAKFHGFDHIVYACALRDYDEFGIEETVNFAKIFNAKVTVLHVADPISIHLDEVKFNRLRKKVKETDEYGKVKFEMIIYEERFSAIDTFIEEEKVDMIALMKYNASFFNRLFHKSVLDRCLYKQDIPMLLLNEENYKI